MMGLKPREQKTLVFIRSHVERYGIAPSYREISIAAGIRSTSNVAHIIDKLVRYNFLCRVDGMARGIDLLQTEDYHVPECNCDRCARARYQADLKLVQALQVAPPTILTHCGIILSDTRIPSVEARRSWLKPRASKAAHQNLPAQAR